MQGVYFVLSVFGWVLWLLVKRGEAALPVTRISGAVPFWDALTTAFSLCAQYLLSRKRWENGWLWRFVD